MCWIRSMPWLFQKYPTYRTFTSTDFNWGMCKQLKYKMRRKRYYYLIAFKTLFLIDNSILTTFITWIRVPRKVARNHFRESSTHMQIYTHAIYRNITQSFNLWRWSILKVSYFSIFVLYAPMYCIDCHI